MFPAFPSPGSLFGLSVHPAEIAIRATAIYWFLYALLRYVLRRDLGSMGLTDVLLLVLLADASQNAMAGEYRTISDGFVLVATLVGWSWLLDWAGYRFESVRRWLQPAPLLLVRDGRLQRRPMRREMITEQEVLQKLRQQGIDDLADVKAMFMEADGEISVIRRGVEETPPRPPRSPTHTVAE